MTATIDPLEGYSQAIALFIPFEGLHNFWFHIFYLFLVIGYWFLVLGSWCLGIGHGDGVEKHGTEKHW